MAIKVRKLTDRQYQDLRYALIRNEHPSSGGASGDRVLSRGLIL